MGVILDIPIQSPLCSCPGFLQKAQVKAPVLDKSGWAPLALALDLPREARCT